MPLSFCIYLYVCKGLLLNISLTCSSLMFTITQKKTIKVQSFRGNRSVCREQREPSGTVGGEGGIPDGGIHRIGSCFPRVSNPYARKPYRIPERVFVLQTVQNAPFATDCPRASNHVPHPFQRPAQSPLSVIILMFVTIGRR